ncbi:MAG: TIGR00266 family protein [Acidimicrobiales bacterium]|nr:TIGR00266 family protein [Acidimicrobiales bacterium]
MAICHDVDYEVKGDDLQFVEIGLDTGETVVAEAGAMMFLEEGIDFETKMGDGSEPDAGMFKKLKSAAGRAISQESVFLTHFTNSGGGRKVAAFSSDVPGKILPLDMGQLGSSILAQKDAFLAAALGTKLSVAFHKRFGAGLFGGEGFILQHIEGDGMAFLNAGGTIVEKHLVGETLRVDTGCIVAFEDGIDYSIERAGNLKSMVFGGEGVFLATLSGSGRVWLQSLPFSRLADRIIQHAPAAGGTSKGEGSILGGLGRLLD